MIQKIARIYLLLGVRRVLFFGEEAAQQGSRVSCISNWWQSFQLKIENDFK
jgi:hypothetical protein